TGHDHTAAVEILTPGLEHFGNEIDGAIAGGFLAHARAAPGQTLASQNARFIAVGHALVLAEHIADLALADADVTGGNIGIFTDVAAELDHVRLAEAHDFHFRAALGIEIRSALAAADGHAGQCVLESLLEAEEFHDPQVDAGVEAQAA